MPDISEVRLTGTVRDAARPLSGSARDYDPLIGLASDVRLRRPFEADREVSGTDLKGNGTIVFTQFKRREADEYFLLEVTQGQGATQDVVWTDPIWLVSERYSPKDTRDASGR
jgi:hypothetical protein